MESELLALIAVLVGAVVYLAKRPAKPVAPVAPVAAVAPVAPVAPILPLAAVHDWTKEIERIDHEIEMLREWRHQTASTVGAVGMLPDLMRRLNALRERVVRLEAKLDLPHDGGSEP